MKMTEKEKNAPTRAEIMNLLFESWNPKRTAETVPLDGACGRITAEDVYAVNTIPVVRSSAMDGIAVRSADFAGGVMPDTRSWEYGVDYIRADTGDDFDDRFDAVIAIEDVIKEDGEQIVLTCDPAEIKSGRCVRPQGSMVKAGELLIPQGYEITPLRLAALATGGVKEVRVMKRPVVAFLPTGSELIPAGTPLQRGQNIDANSLLMRELIRSFGGEPMLLPIVKDQMTQLESALLSALENADIVLINGGSSKGSEDYSIVLIEKYGTVLQHYVRSAPGRPMSVSIVHKKLIVNVPGPTFAAMAVSDWAVKPAIDHYLERVDQLPQTVTAVMEEDMMSPPFMEIYKKVIVRFEDGVYYAKPLEREARMDDGSGRCNGILVTELGKKGYQKGEQVQIKLI